MRPQSWGKAVSMIAVRCKKGFRTLPRLLLHPTGGNGVHFQSEEEARLRVHRLLAWAPSATA